MDDPTTDSYPALRRVLGDDGFRELARLIRTTYEAGEHRLRDVAAQAELGVDPAKLKGHPSEPDAV